MIKNKTQVIEINFANNENLEIEEKNDATVKEANEENFEYTFYVAVNVVYFTKIDKSMQLIHLGNNSRFWSLITVA